MLWVYMGRAESGGSCGDLTLDLCLDKVQYFLVSIELIGPYIYGHLASVGDDIMLGASLDDREAHLGRA